MTLRISGPKGAFTCFSRQPNGVLRRRCRSASGSSGERAVLAARAARRAALKTYRKYAQTGAASVAQFGGNASRWHRLIRGTHPYANGIRTPSTRMPGGGDSILRPSLDPEGAGPVHDASTLYLVVSGAPAPEGIPALVAGCQEAGWRVVAFSTPIGVRFIDPTELERLTGEPVRSEYRMPNTGKAAPPADAVLACPLTFNSVNKASGHLAGWASACCSIRMPLTSAGCRPGVRSSPHSHSGP